MERLCIYPKDVQVITGKSERYGRSLIRKIKDANNKPLKNLVSIEEFCSYTGLEKSSVLQLMKY